MLQRSLSVSTGRCTVILSVVALLCAGCGGGSSLSGPKGTVSGKVLYNGSPVEAGCTVMFMHVETSQSAISSVEADGSYSLRMQGGTKVLAGPYKISVAPPTVETPDENDLEAYAAMMEGGSTPKPPPAALFPEKYHSPDSSGLTFTVEEGANTYDIELTD